MKTNIYAKIYKILQEADKRDTDHSRASKPNYFKYLSNEATPFI